MANSKSLVGYTGEDKVPAVPTSVSNVLVRTIKSDCFTNVIESVEVDAYANEISGAPWGAQNVVWLKEPKCVVSFDANGGSGTMDDRFANIGIAFTIPECSFIGAHSRDFVKWAVGSPAGAQIQPGYDYAFAGDTTLYALWKEGWEYPEQTGNVLRVVQAETITQTDNKIGVQ